MEYSTYIFEESKKKISANRNYTLAIIGAVCLCAFFFIIGVPGIGILTTVTMGATLFKMKSEDDKSAGITAYGSRKANIVIAEDHLIVRGTQINFIDLKNLIIYVDEYMGMPKIPLGSYHGGNNEITFLYKGKEYSFNYIIKNKRDFRYVEDLVDRIEKKYK